MAVITNRDKESHLLSSINACLKFRNEDNERNNETSLKKIDFFKTWGCNLSLQRSKVLKRFRVVSFYPGDLMTHIHLIPKWPLIYADTNWPLLPRSR